MNKQGFTLVELLTVILIIGILSSLALPGYMRSVERARATEAMGAIKALNESISVYYVEKEVCPSFNKLVVSLPEAKNFTFTLDASDWVPGTECNGVKATRNGGGYSYYLWKPYKQGLPLQCDGPTAKDQEFCKSLSYYQASAS